MSSLAAALDPSASNPDSQTLAYYSAGPSILPKDDVDMQQPETDSVDGAPQDARDDEEMGDLFGEEHDVDLVKHKRCAARSDRLLFVPRVRSSCPPPP